MGFNKRYMSENVLRRTFDAEGIDGILRLMRVDAILNEDVFSLDFNNLYNEYLKDKNENSKKKLETFFYVH